MKKLAVLVSAILLTGNAFAAECYEAVAKEALTRALKTDGLVELTLLDSISGRVGYEVNQSPRHENEFVVEISYYKGDSADPIATSQVRSLVTDFKTCKIQAN